MAKQKSRFPSYGLVRGPSHAQGGVAGVVAGKQPVELEGGEWVIPKEVVPDYLPQLVQMTNEGRAMQGMDNGNSAIDALIASSVMQNGMVSPKSPHYQEGGEVITKNLQMTRPVSRDLQRKKGMFHSQSILSIPAEQVGGDEGLRYYLSEPQMSDDMQMAITQADFDARAKMAFAPEDSLPAALVEGYFDRQNKKSPLGFLKKLLGKQRGGGPIYDYQEGGAVADRTRVSQTYYPPEETLNLPMADLVSPSVAGSISQAPLSDEEMMQIVMDVAVPGAAIGSIGKKALSKMASKAGRARRPAHSLSPEDIASRQRQLEMESRVSGSDYSRMPRQVGEAYDEFLGRPGGGGRMLSEGFFDPAVKAKFRKRFQAVRDALSGAQDAPRNPSVFMDEAFESGMDLSEAFAARKKIYGFQQGGPVDYSQTAGLYNRFLAQGDSPDMMRTQDILKWRALQDAESSSPEMYDAQSEVGRQFGKDALLTQALLSSAGMEGASAEDKYDLVKALSPAGRQVYYSQYFDDKRAGGPIDYYQTGGQVLPRKQQEIRRPEMYGPPVPADLMTPAPDTSGAALDSMLMQIMMRDVNESINPLTGDTMDFAKDSLQLLDRMRKSNIPRDSSRVIMQQGGMVESPQLMQDMSQDRRIKPLQPDRYIIKQDVPGGTSQREMSVPKLHSAYLGALGMETPLSKRQGALLSERGISPQSMAPHLQSLVGRVLIQRLGNEPQ